MALGKRLFQIDFQDYAKGVSTSDAIADGGFSNTTDQVNLTTVPGLMYMPAQSADHSTNLTGQMLSSCEDPTGNYARIFVSADSSDDGRFYSMSGAFALTQRGSTDSSHNYVQGRTDMIAFDGEAYITNDSTIVRWSSIGSSDTINNTFFSFTNALAPHPAIVYNSFAYYGDGNLLKRQAGAGVAPVTILTLTTGTVIVALGVDPGSGYMLISTIGQINLSGTINSGAEVVFYNGASSTFQRQVPVDDMVTAFPVAEGTLYAAYGQNLGQWNGSGVTFLRKLNVSFDNTQLAYENHFTSIGPTLYFIQKHQIMAYGPVRQKGNNVFYPAFANTPSGIATNLSHITYLGSNNLGMSYATSKFFTWDSSSVVTGNTQDFFSNIYEFDNEFWIRWIRVIYGAQISDNGDPGSMRLRNEDGIVTSVNPTLAGLIDLRNVSGGASAYKDLTNINVKLKQVQIELILDTINAGIRRVIVYGEPADLPR